MLAVEIDLLKQGGCWDKGRDVTEVKAGHLNHCQALPSGALTLSVIEFNIQHMLESLQGFWY